MPWGGRQTISRLCNYTFGFDLGNANLHVGMFGLP